MTTKKPAVRVGNLVRVGDDRQVWKVLALAAGVAHLTRMLADPRCDWRGVTVDRLTVAEGILR